MSNKKNNLDDKLLFDVGGFIKLHKYELVSFDNSLCVLSAPIINDSLNPYGMAHGGFIYGLMDSCAGIHIALETKRNAVTTSSSLNFIKASKGSKIIAKSKIIKAGKTISTIEVSTYDDKDQLVAIGIFNYYYIN